MVQGEREEMSVGLYQWCEVRQRAEHGEQLPIEKRQVPMVDLPLGATEDRLCGTIDIEKALSEGVRAFEPGLLAKANRGLLYVDEVNLLDDHLVDVLLDSAASGWNTVEREGVSVRHPARFVLIGSGNPEEGELRPQLLDRFGMSVEVRTVRDPELRVQVVDQRTSFDNDPDGFNNAVQTTQDALQARVVEAQNRLPHVQIDDDLRIRVAQSDISESILPGGSHFKLADLHGHPLSFAPQASLRPDPAHLAWHRREVFAT
mgnify:CR=1 FL=1